jgi:hypothetical protein
MAETLDTFRLGILPVFQLVEADASLTISEVHGQKLLMVDLIR